MLAHGPLLRFTRRFQVLYVCVASFKDSKKECSRHVFANVCSIPAPCAFPALSTATSYSSDQLGWFNNATGTGLTNPPGSPLVILFLKPNVSQKLPRLKAVTWRAIRSILGKKAHVGCLRNDRTGWRGTVLIFGDIAVLSWHLAVNIYLYKYTLMLANSHVCSFWHVPSIKTVCYRLPHIFS